MTTAAETAALFFSGQMCSLLQEGFDVHVISSPPDCRLPALPCTAHYIPMRRAVSPLEDVRALLRLIKLISNIAPDIVHTHTPKAGLLGMCASFLVGVPIRLYTVNGLPLLTGKGTLKAMLWATEFLACTMASSVLCVSRSMRRALIAYALCGRRKAFVLGDGASHGVDIDEFDPGRYQFARRDIRRTYKIPTHAIVVGYVGRLVPDKGIRELAAAWLTLRERFPDLRLFLCGYLEKDHALARTVLQQLLADPRVHLTPGRVEDMPPVYAATDVCVLPSYREGLPNVALECGAMRIPIVASRIPGCVDVVRDGVSGLLVPAKDPEALAAAIGTLVENAPLRRRMGEAARDLVSRRFAKQRVSGLLLARYKHILCSNDSHAAERPGESPLRAASQ